MKTKENFKNNMEYLDYLCQNSDWNSEKVECFNDILSNWQEEDWKSIENELRDTGNLNDFEIEMAKLSFKHYLTNPTLEMFVIYNVPLFINWVEKSNTQKQLPKVKSFNEVLDLENISENDNILEEYSKLFFVAKKYISENTINSENIREKINQMIIS